VAFETYPTDEGVVVVVNATGLELVKLVDESAQK
jgi:hypothetical protein